MAVRKIFLGVLIWIVVPLILILVTLPLSLVFTYHFFVTIVLRKIFRKDLLGPIKSPDFNFSGDAFWDSPRSGIAFLYLVEGILTEDSISSRLSQILSEKSHVGGKNVPNYDRLTSIYPEFWLGYPFWKKMSQNFDLKVHVRVLSKDPDDSTLDLKRVFRDWLVSPYARNQPLWDIFLIPQLSDGNGGVCSYFGFRIHHVIGDGYSMLDFLGKLFDEGSTEVMPALKNSSRTTAESWKRLFWIPLTIGKHFSDFTFHSDYFSTKKLRSTNSLNWITLKLNEIKAIRQSLSSKFDTPIPFSVLILFILGSALRRAAINGILKGDLHTMKNLNVTMAAPKSHSSHPKGKFCNHWSHGVVPVPLRSSNPYNRLNEMVREFAWLKECDAFETNVNWTDTYSIMPRCVYNSVMKSCRSTTIGFTNLPGPTHSVHLCGRLVKEKHALVGLQMTQASFTMGCFSYNNHLSICLVANEEVFSFSLGEKILSEYFLDEFKDLLQNGIGNETTV